MDLTKFMYNDITPDMIDRFFNEGKELKQIDYDEFLKLPLNEPKSDEKINFKPRCWRGSMCGYFCCTKIGKRTTSIIGKGNESSNEC